MGDKQSLIEHIKEVIASINRYHKGEMCVSLPRAGDERLEWVQLDELLEKVLPKLEEHHRLKEACCALLLAHNDDSVKKCRAAVAELCGKTALQKAALRCGIDLNKVKQHPEQLDFITRVVYIEESEGSDDT